METLPVCQIALSVSDVKRTHYWYRRVFGLLSAGQYGQYGSDEIARAQMLPESEFNIWWLVDQQDWFEFELFQFSRPTARAMPPDWRRSDLGYVGFGMHVAAFDDTLRRLAHVGGRVLSPSIGVGGERRVCLRDPDGILIELMEADLRVAGSTPRARPEVPSVARSVTISVADLESASRFWVDTLGLTVRRDVRLHSREHESLWGLPGASSQSLTLSAGDFFVELVQYTSPEPRPRPAGFLLSDHGLMNLAFGSRDRNLFDTSYKRLRKAGYRGDAEPMELGDMGAFIYLRSNEELCVELLHLTPKGEAALGYVPD